MEQLRNNPRTTLVGNISNSVTTITVADAAAFPGEGNFVINIEGEFIKVTAVSGNVFTVVRGTEFTPGASHLSGKDVVQVITNQVLKNLFNELHQRGVASARPTTARVGTVYVCSDFNIKWRFNGANWDVIYPTYIPYASHINLGAFTALNQGTSTWTNVKDVIVATIPSSLTNVRGFIKTIPTAPWTITCAVQWNTTDTNTVRAGILLYDGTKAQVYGINIASVLQGLANPTFSTVTTQNGAGTTTPLLAGGVVWLRIQDDNTNWLFSFSTDGVNFTTYASVARNTYLTPTHCGFGVVRNYTSPASDLSVNFLSYLET